MTDGERIVLDLLAYAEEHPVDLVSLLLILAWSSEPEEHDDSARANGVPSHYYPH